MGANGGDGQRTIRRGGPARRDAAHGAGLQDARDRATPDDGQAATAVTAGIFLVPTLCVGTPGATLCVAAPTQVVSGPVSRRGASGGGFPRRAWEPGHSFAATFTLSGSIQCFTSAL